MTYEIYRYIYIGCLLLAILLLVLSAILFFVLRIPNVIGDLSGANAKKAIENIRKHNENTGEKTYKSSKVNRERGRLTDKISGTGRLLKHTTGNLYGAMPTGKIGTQKLKANETTLLDSGGNETTVLHTNSNETTVLNTGSSQTAAADRGGNETTILNAGEEDTTGTFIIEFEITYIHTNEVIV